MERDEEIAVARRPAFNSGHELRVLFEAGSQVGLSDRQLIERFQAAPRVHAEAAFGTIVERHGPMVYRTCRRLLGNDHDAQDAFQIAFLMLARKCQTLWVGESLGPWLHRVACRASNRLRSQHNRRRAVLHEFAARAAEPRGTVEHPDLLAIIHEELDRLPDHYRAAIVLCDLEGQSCEQTARQLGCPIGTLGSRLARGREKLRSRLIRRGIAPAAATFTSALAIDASSTCVPISLVESTARAGFELSAQASGSIVAAGAGRLSRELTRSMLMNRWKSVASTGLATAAVCLVSVLSFKALAGSGMPGARPFQESVPDSKKVAKSAGTDETPTPGVDKNPNFNPEFAHDARRYENYLIAIIGNCLSDRDKREAGTSVTREAILYQDGTAKLWSLKAKDPVCPPLRDTTPIREIGFADNEMLVTSAERSVRFWNGVTGALIKDLPGEVLRPLSFRQDQPPSYRFVTLNTEGTEVTLRDAKSLAAVDHLHPEVSGGRRWIGAAIEADGTTVALIADDRTVSLWDLRTKRSFATLQPSSRLTARVFADDVPALFQRPVLRMDKQFWQSVEPLKPAPTPAPAPAPPAAQ